MSTMGEPTPIYATRGKEELARRQQRQQWGRRACIGSQAEAADGIKSDDGEASKELFTIGSMRVMFD